MLLPLYPTKRLYIGPALYPSEKNLILPMAVASTVYFTCVSFGYFVILEFIFVFARTKPKMSLLSFPLMIFYLPQNF